MYPHWWRDLIPKLGFGEMRVLATLIEETIGWHREGWTVTQSDVAREAGLMRRHAVAALESLQERGLVASAPLGCGKGHAKTYRLVPQGHRALDPTGAGVCTPGAQPEDHKPLKEQENGVFKERKKGKKTTTGAPRRRREPTRTRPGEVTEASHGRYPTIDAHNAGYSAGLQGHPQNANPYAANTEEHRCWRNGWQEGSRARRGAT
jgi:ribosome modulation factor